MVVRIEYAISPAVTNEAMNALFAASWPNHGEVDYGPELAHSLLYVCANAGDRLIGFVNVAWNGGIHAFILDTTVHPDFQRRGIGVRLVREAADAARLRGMEWLHVDYDPHLDAFYRACGFEPTPAGLMRLR
jgi:GNAT superfamily N-acetyltransferase